MRPVLCLVTLSIPSLCTMDTEAEKFYDRTHQLNDIALITRCYAQHALRPYFGPVIYQIRHLIKIRSVNAVYLCFALFPSY